MDNWMRGVRVASGAAVAAAFFAACSSSQGGEHVGATKEAVSSTPFPKATVDQELGSGDFADAQATSQAFLANSPSDCQANYANLIASTLAVVDSIKEVPDVLRRMPLGWGTGEAEQTGYQLAGMAARPGAEYPGEPT